MIRSVVNKLIHNLGRTGYQMDQNIRIYNLVLILSEKFLQLLRGLFLRPFLKRCTGLVFLGRHCRIMHKNLIHAGKTLFIGDYVEINALSRFGVHFGDNVSIHRGTVIECVGGIRAIG